MSRIVYILTACIACSAVACGDNQDSLNSNVGGEKVQIILFEASPDTISAGDSTQLLFAVVPTDAKVAITGVGDFTGQDKTSVSPADTTTYHLTATSKNTTVEKTVTVTVKPVVRSLVYTAPATGRVRLVANAAQSTAQVVQLDLVANERLERSSFFALPVNGVNVNASPGSFAAGMDLPLDTTRVTGDTTLFTAGPALAFVPPAPPPAPPAVQPLGVGKIGSDHVLYTAVSRKRVAGMPILTQANEVQPGQVFFSVRLKLAANATTGPVFDGSQPTALYRAAVRDQFGDDFVSQAEIGVGKLEVRETR